ncbi:MAG: hypothetical protein ACR2RF_06860 [Geminicoccaceae bacterium]
MTPVSLMPPVDYCPSCEGRKAESKAFDIGETRAQQAELQAADDPTATSAPGAPPPVDSAAEAVGDDRSRPVASAVQTLLAPDLAVHASLARPAIEAGSGEAEALRLRATEAYQAL